MRREKDVRLSDISWQRKLASLAVSLFCLAKIFSRKTMPSGPKKILVMQWGYLGDMVCATPALRALRREFRSAEISLLTSPENMSYLNGCPYVDRVLYIRNPLHAGRVKFSLRAVIACISLLRKNVYDIVMELNGRLTDQVFLAVLRTGYSIGQDPLDNFYLLNKRIHSFRKSQIERNIDVIRGLVASVDDLGPEGLWSPVKDRDRESVSALLSSKNIGNNYAVIHAAASWGPRRWSSGRWKVVAEYLSTKGVTMIFIGTAEDITMIEAIRALSAQKGSFSFAGLLDIAQTIALMEKASFFVGSDSGPMHLAAVAKLGGVILFGPGDPVKWSHPIHTVIYKNPECGPCPQFAFSTTCREGYRQCKALDAITAEDVIKACERYL